MASSRRRGWCNWGSCLVVTMLYLGVAPESARAGPKPAEESTYAARLALATEHFSAQRYELARELFDALAADSTAAPQRPTLTFNAAVCSFALQQYEDARSRFEAVAREGSELAPLARVNAGFAALHAGDLDAAETFASSSPADGDDIERRRLALLEQVRAARRARHDQSLAAGLDAGFEAVARRDWSAARAELSRVVSSAGRDDDDAELADAHYGLGLVAMAHGEPALAQHHFEQSLLHRPDDARALLALGNASEEARELHAAEAAYTTALAQPLSGEDVESARRGLDRLYALPPSGPSGFASFGLGYDDNATQSGSREALGALGEVTARGPADASSPFVSALVGLDWTQRSTHKAAWSLHYVGDWLALTDSRLQEFGLQSHAVSARGQWSPTLDTRVRLEVGGAHVLTGSTSFEPFEWDLVLTARAEVDTGARSRARLQVSERLLRAPDFEYLDGHRVDGALSHAWRWSAWELSASALVRYYAAGVERLDLSPNSFPACNRDCEGRSYHNVFSYWGPGLGLSSAWAVTSALRLSALGRVEQRRYLEASGIPGIRASFAERRDIRWRAQLGAELELDSADRYRLTFDQTLSIAASNVQFDANDPAHEYDLGDRSFAQNTTEVGVSASF